MTDRAQLFGDGPRACPFVAFDDDRDRRADEPDHRHRCYAEPTPAPRALAHQAAYCLSSEFPTCPIFLDWAVRAAADPVMVRPQAALPVATGERGTTAHAALPARDAEPDGSWAAPPPWVADPSAANASTAPGRAQQLSAFPVDERPDDRDDELLRPHPAPLPAVERIASSPAVEPWPPDDGDGAAASPAGARPGGSASTEDDLVPAPPFLAARDRGSTPSGAALPLRPPVQARPSPTSAKPTRPSGESIFPTWDRSRRFEAYPTLRTRAGMRRVSPVLLGVVALALAAALLFLLPGFLAQRPGGAGGGSPTPTTAETPASFEPTPTPAPTPVRYTVRSGDTLSRIAKRFGLTVEQIVCANDIRNPNVLDVGQVLIIPDDEFECPFDAAPTRRP